MTKAKSRKKYALIAAIIYAILAVYPIITYIISHSKTRLNVIYWIILVGLVVTLFIKDKKPLAFAAGANALHYIFLFIANGLDVGSLFSFFAYAALLVTIFVGIENNAITKKIWFLSGTLLLVGYLLKWFLYDSSLLLMLIQRDYFPRFIIWEYWLLRILEIISLFFVGMWLMDDIAPVTSSSTIGGADKLKTFKELLDSGTITQEEFDAKKKEILGL